MNYRTDLDHYGAEMLPLAGERKEKTAKYVRQETQEEIDVCLNCTRKQCNGGGQCMIAQHEAQRKCRRWTKEENDYLMQNHKTMTTKDISIALSRSERAVVTQISKLLKGEAQ